MPTTEEPCCNAKIRKSIMDNNHSITAVYFNLSNIQNVNAKPKDRVSKTGQAIEIYANVVMKRSGEIRNKKHNSFIAHVYCPFCGKKYE